MRIYIAAPYAVRDELRRYAELLRDFGHIVTASWLDAQHPITPDALETAKVFDDAYARDHAIQDIEEVLESDCVIAVTWDTALALTGNAELGGNSGGRHVEVGVALGSNIPVLVWGTHENIFHRGLCAADPTWEGIVQLVGDVQAARFGLANSVATEGI